MHARGLGRSRGRQTELFIALFDLDPVHLQANQLPGNAALVLLDQRGFAHEVVFFEMHHPAEAKLVGRVLLLSDQRLLAAVVVDFDQKQSGFDAGNVEREHARGVNVERAAGVYERVPDFDRRVASAIQRYPDFVSEIAGVTGARDVHGHAGNFAAGYAKVFQVGDIGFGHALQHFARSRSLKRERRDRFGGIFDLDFHVEAVLAEPAQAGIGCGPAILILLEAGDGAVVDDHPLLVTPAAVDHLARLHLVDVARDHAVHQLGGVLARDDVLVQRRDIDQRRRIANRVVLMLVMHLVGAYRVVTGPLAIIQAVAQRKSTFVKCSTDGQRNLDDNVSNSRLYETTPLMTLIKLIE